MVRSNIVVKHVNGGCNFNIAWTNIDQGHIIELASETFDTSFQAIVIIGKVFIITPEFHPTVCEILDGTSSGTKSKIPIVPRIKLVGDCPHEGKG
ncbi:hypothetical protein CO663_34470 [Rhizobium anhuiense]|nr:hypothetical protein CO663_34470 [Rhizobium anhuiense]